MKDAFLPSDAVDRIRNNIIQHGEHFLHAVRIADQDESRNTASFLTQYHVHSLTLRDHEFPDQPYYDRLFATRALLQDEMHYIFGRSTAHASIAKQILPPIDEILDLLHGAPFRPQSHVLHPLESLGDEMPAEHIPYSVLNIMSTSMYLGSARTILQPVVQELHAAHEYMQSPHPQEQRVELDNMELMNLSTAWGKATTLHMLSVLYEATQSVRYQQDVPWKWQYALFNADLDTARRAHKPELQQLLFTVADRFRPRLTQRGRYHEMIYHALKTM